MFSTVWGKKIIIFSLAVALHWRLLWGGGRLELWLLLNDTSKTPAATEKKNSHRLKKGQKFWNKILIKVKASSGVNA